MTDSTGNVGRLTLERLKINKSFAYLSGDDQSSLGYLAHGGHGCISVTANVAPVLYREMVAAARSNHIDLARSIHERLMPLHVALFIDPSPAGVKYAMSKLGFCENELRAPLSTASESTRRKIDEALAKLGLT